MEKQVETKRQLPNRYIYTVFVVAAIISVCIKDFSTAIIFGGIALAFDPFNQSVPFPQRALWQRLWLLIHCIFVLVLLVLSIMYH